MDKKYLVIAALLSTICALDANESADVDVNDNEISVVARPWLTGPLLTGSGYTIPKGHFNIEPYVYYNDNIGYFNNRWHLQRFSHQPVNVNFQELVQIGLLSMMELDITPQFFYSYEDHRHAWRFGDLPIKLAFQIAKENDHGIPAIKFAMGEIFPVGTYENLDPTLNGTDAGGGGSFVTNFSLVASKLFHIYDLHFFSLRTQGVVSLYTPVKVHGINTYGGDSTTSGRVFPGTSFDVLVGMEYTITQHLALALDIANEVHLKTKFQGVTLTPVGSDHIGYILSFAPAIEWNFTPNLGLIGGLWIAAFGIDTDDFVNGIIAFNWYI